jgi:preprotein translocase subunit Sec63
MIMDAHRLQDQDDMDLRDIEDEITPPETNYYRRLCRTFHPDKHATDPETKQAAEERFQLIQRAYEGEFNYVR